MTRRLFLTAFLLLLPLTVMAPQPAIVDTGLVANWLGHVPEGFSVIAVANASSLPFMPTEIYRVYQLNPDGAPIALYLYR
jgi:hypothetical protein